MYNFIVFMENFAKKNVYIYGENHVHTEHYEDVKTRINDLGNDCIVCAEGDLKLDSLDAFLQQNNIKIANLDRDTKEERERNADKYVELLIERENSRDKKFIMSVNEELSALDEKIIGRDIKWKPIIQDAVNSNKNVVILCGAAHVDNVKKYLNESGVDNNNISIEYGKETEQYSQSKKEPSFGFFNSFLGEENKVLSETIYIDNVDKKEKSNLSFDGLDSKYDINFNDNILDNINDEKKRSKSIDIGRSSGLSL